MVAGIESFAGTPLLVERSRMSAAPRSLRLADRERRRIVYRFAVHRARVVETAAGAFLLPGPVKMHPRVLEAMAAPTRSEEHTSELQSRLHLVCRLLLEKKKT